MIDPRSTTPSADHAGHDLLLVAAAADRGGRLPTTQAGCPDCRALHADLVALAAAVPSAARPTRPRSYTLTPADAARLRPAGWRRWFGVIGSSRDVVTRPLAIGLTTLGLAGLLVATVPGALPGAGGATGALPAAGEAAAPAPASAAPSAAPVAEMPARAASTAPSAAPAAAASSAAAAEPSTESMMDVAGAAESQKSDGDGVFSGGDDADAAASAAADAGTEAASPDAEALVIRDDARGVSALSVMAIVVLILGLSLFGLRWTARRT